MEIIFNELSLIEPAADRYTGRNWMEAFYATIKAALAHGMKPLLRTHGGFWSLYLAPDYTLARWGEDTAVDKELRRRIKGMAGRAPFIETLLSAADDASGNLADFHWNRQKALGLGLAVLRDHAVVSMPADGWCEDPVTVHACYVTLAGTAEVIECVCNLYDPACVQRRECWIGEHVQAEITCGRVLIDRQLEILPCLDFVPGCVDQLSALTGHERTFRFVVKHLLALNSQARSWVDGNFEQDYPFPCSPESQTTLDKYGAERTFLCMDNEYRMFSWHSKINVDAWRIHFIADPGTRRVLIGYVGKHLPTVGDPT